MKIFWIASLFLVVISCQRPVPVEPPVEVDVTEEMPEEAPETAPETGPSADTKGQWPSEVQIARRVSDAQRRLESSEGGTLVWKSIQAHGGLKRWFANGPIQFRFNYRPQSDRPPINTLQTVDTWSSRAVHYLEGGARFGWDGARAWIHPSDATPPTNARFWALTPYYFVGLPFVLADPGVVLTREEDVQWDGKSWHVVRATFEDGVGDAPDDFYVLYLDRETHRLGAFRYVVSYPGFFPDGGHGAENFMSFDDPQTVDGIVLAGSYITYGFEDGEPTEIKTETTVSEVEFVPFEPAIFEAPEDAKMQAGY